MGKYTIVMMGWLLTLMNLFIHLATLAEGHLHLMTGISVKEPLLLELVALLVLGISSFPSIFLKFMSWDVYSSERVFSI